MILIIHKNYLNVLHRTIGNCLELIYLGDHSICMYDSLLPGRSLLSSTTVLNDKRKHHGAVGKRSLDWQFCKSNMNTFVV